MNEYIISGGGINLQPQVRRQRESPQRLKNIKSFFLKKKRSQRVWREPTDDVVVCGPDIDVDSAQNTEKGKAPGDAINNDLLAVGKKLVNNRPQQEEVNYRPARLQCPPQMRSFRKQAHQIKKAHGAGVK